VPVLGVLVLVLVLAVLGPVALLLPCVVLLKSKRGPAAIRSQAPFLGLVGPKTQKHEHRLPQFWDRCQILSPYLLTV